MLLKLIQKTLIINIRERDQSILIVNHPQRLNLGHEGKDRDIQVTTLMVIDNLGKRNTNLTRIFQESSRK